jgi:hypothetical protein
LPKERLREFLDMFSFGFRRIDEKIRHWRFYKNGINISIGKFISDMGICENCENFSEHLKPDISNHMVCENCR